MKSAMQLCCEHAAIQPTKRSRNRNKPIPIASEVVTFDYGWKMRKTMWDRLSARKVR